MVFQQESIQEALDEINALAMDHYSEVAVFQDIPLDPDFERYIMLEENGITRLYTARNKGELVGYALFYLSNSIQYSKSYQASQDILYIKPDCRGSGIGKNFLKFIDGMLKDEGVQVVYHHTKVKKDFGKLLEKLGYTHTDSVYARRLDLCVGAVQ